MIVIAAEVYKLRTSSDQLNMVIIKLVDSQLHIDIIGAAGKGKFGLSLWSESGFVNSMNREIRNICDLNKLTVTKRIHEEE